MESMVGRLTFQHAQALEEITKFESFPVTLVFQVPKAQDDALLDRLTGKHTNTYKKRWTITTFNGKIMENPL